MITIVDLELRALCHLPLRRGPLGPGYTIPQEISTLETHHINVSSSQIYTQLKPLAFFKVSRESFWRIQPALDGLSLAKYLKDEPDAWTVDIELSGRPLELHETALKSLLTSLLELVQAIESPLLLTQMPIA